jgi:hypothetical protein
MTAAENVDLAGFSALIGAVLPVFASILKQDRLSAKANTMIAVTLAATAAIIITTGKYELSPRHAAVSFAIIYTAAVAFDHGLWKPIGVARAVQTRTSFKRRKQLVSPARAPVSPARVLVSPARVHIASSPAQRDLSRC